MSDLKWPSFTVQGIILATNTTFIIKGGGYINTWIFISLLLVLILFALQTTSVDFLYLYRTENGIDAPNYKTHIIRIVTMISLLCLYMGVYHPNANNKNLVLSMHAIDGYILTLFVAILLIVIIPIIFNFAKRKMRT